MTPASDISYTYDGASSRVLMTTDSISGECISRLYNALGETVGQTKNGVSSISDTDYEIESNILWRARETAVVVTNVRYTIKTRLYDSENRVCGYALTNAAGRGVSVSLVYDGSYLMNMDYTLSVGDRFAVRLSRDTGRRNLVTRRDYFFGDESIYWYSTEYDLLNRPTNATDSVSLAREWRYNHRSELVGATLGTGRYGYAYDSIGNRLWSSVNAVTNAYAANRLNQYTSLLRGSMTPCEIMYDADGNLTNDGCFVYAYDAENRLVPVYPVNPVQGSLAVENRYDHRNRRIRKIVKRHNGFNWQINETHTFVWDGNNIVFEQVAFVNGTSRTFEYFWGADKSGTEQGAGGVEGLLAISMDGVFYIPCYDHNGNIVLYVSETGSIAAQYVYDPYGNVTDTNGILASVFSFGFSTKHHDRETGMVGYQRRFYRPDLGRWLNRDPIEEEGGENLYAFCRNAPSSKFDMLGQNIYLYTGNDSGRWLNDQLHQSVVVDEWSVRGKQAIITGKVGFTFAFEGNWEWYGPSFSWLVFSGFVLPGYWMEGEVEEVGYPPGSPVAEKKTTCAQDRAWLRQMRAKVGRRDVYSVGRHNCRNFSQSEFEAAPGKQIK